MAPRAQKDSVRPRRVAGVVARPLNFTVRRQTVSALAFFQPWMAIVGAVVMVGAVIHKRRWFQPPKGLSLSWRILLVSGVYFIPALLGWLFVAAVGLRALADSGHAMPSAAVSACTALGASVLGFLILGNELAEAGRAQPKW